MSVSNNPNQLVKLPVNSIVATAQAYKWGVETIYSTGIASLECVQAAATVIGTTWQKGLSGTAKEITKACIGVNDLKKAREEMATSYVTLTDSKGNTYYMRRTFPDRVGTAAGHVWNAVAKASMATAACGLAGTYGFGCVIDWNTPHGAIDFSKDSYLVAAQGTAKAVNMTARIAFGPLRYCAEGAIEAARIGISFAAGHPSETIVAAGAGALLYGAATEIVNAANSKGKIEKFVHSMTAVALVGGLCLTPQLPQFFSMSART